MLEKKRRIDTAEVDQEEHSQKNADMSQTSETEKDGLTQRMMFRYGRMWDRRSWLSRSQDILACQEVKTVDSRRKGKKEESK